MWFGTDFGPGIPDAILRLSPNEADKLGNFVRHRAHEATAMPRPSRLGELRPYVGTMRSLDEFWSAGPLFERVCTVLTYADSATIFDPFSFTIEEFADPTTTSEQRFALRHHLAAAAQLLVQARPLVLSGALDLIPPYCTREFAPDLPKFAMDDELLQRYAQSGLNERIGDFNRSLGAAHSTGRYRGYQHLWQINQDLLVVDRHSDLLQPLFVAGFDLELARLMAVRSLPAMRHVGVIAAFRFPILQVTPLKVIELRDTDEVSSWRQSLRSALAAVDPAIQGVPAAQAQVHEILTPVAELFIKSLRTRWSDIRWTGVEQFVVGGLTTAVALTAGADASEAVASGVTSASLTTAWTGWRARGRPTNLDVPFLSMTPDNDRCPPLAIPKMGLL